MAVDVCSCSSSEPFISPRISFSHDLNNQSSETATVTTTTSISTAFDFCINTNLELSLISADELFSNGVLLPTQIKKPKAVVSETEAVEVHRKRLKELLSENDDKLEKTSTRSFWKFTRATSLNSSNTMGPKRMLRSLSLKRLLHSSSTTNPMGNEDVKVIKKSSSRKEPPVSSSCLSSVDTLPEPMGRRSLTKKDSGGGVQTNPALNISPAYNMNLFGYGSLFFKGKTKNKSK
ncbi:hypothetical protein R6Q59_002704 [Mikania micrantha]